VAGQITLEFGTALGERKTIKNFSAGSRIGRSLFLASDEYGCVDRLTEIAEGRWGTTRASTWPSCWSSTIRRARRTWRGWRRTGLALGARLACATRHKPEKFEDECIDLDLLANLKETRSRCLLAKLPLVDDGDGALRPVREDGERRASMLKQTKHGNALAEALADDPLIKPFTRIPAKEGGLDIEGVAACGDRVALGPARPGDRDARGAGRSACPRRHKQPERLHLDDEPVKRLLAMEGLGIRDLKRCGDDLLILAGPDHRPVGPCAIYRWRGWVQDPPQDARKVRLHRRSGSSKSRSGRGKDHPEGLALWSGDGGQARQILVIYDSPAKSRCDVDAGTIKADLFDLPE
jgi:hypothetical protein